jgi:hypothetical protein
MRQCDAPIGRVIITIHNLIRVLEHIRCRNFYSEYALRLAVIYLRPWNSGKLIFHNLINVAHLESGCSCTWLDQRGVRSTSCYDERL